MKWCSALFQDRLCNVKQCRLLAPYQARFCNLKWLKQWLGHEMMQTNLCTVEWCRLFASGKVLDNEVM